MNVLSDFEIRVNAAYAEKEGSPEVVRLNKLLKEKEKEIRAYEEELKKYRTGKPSATARKKTATKKSAGKKSSRPSQGKGGRKRSSSSGK
jgi:uncharacterized protein YccT (UPF0319 family)